MEAVVVAGDAISAAAAAVAAYGGVCAAMLIMAHTLAKLTARLQTLIGTAKRYMGPSSCPFFKALHSCLSFVKHKNSCFVLVDNLFLAINVHVIKTEIARNG